MRLLKFRFSYLIDIRNQRYPGLFNVGLWYLLLSLASALTFQSGRVILANFGTPADVSEFSLAMQMYLPAWSLILAGGSGLWPIFARRRSEGLEARSIRVQMTTLLAGAGLVAALILLLLGPALSDWLSSGALIPSRATMGAAGAMLILQCLQLVQGVYQTSPAGIKFQAVWSLGLAAVAPTAVALTSGVLGASAPFLSAAGAILIFQIVPNYFKIRGIEKGDRNAGLNIPRRDHAPEALK